MVRVGSGNTPPLCSVPSPNSIPPLLPLPLPTSDFAFGASSQHAGAHPSAQSMLTPLLPGSIGFGPLAGAAASQPPSLAPAAALPSLSSSSPPCFTSPPFGPSPSGGPGWEVPEYISGGENAAMSSEWERHLSPSREDLYLLLSSPARPSTPSQAAPPPYPLRHPTPPNASPHHTAPSSSHPFAMLRLPPPSPHRGPSPARGEQRAMVEWAVASARHASPAWRAASPHLGSLYCASPAHQQSPAHSCAGFLGGIGAMSMCTASLGASCCSGACSSAAGATAGSSMMGSSSSSSGAGSSSSGGGGAGSSSSQQLSSSQLMPPPPGLPGGVPMTRTASLDGARRSPWLSDRPSTDPRSSPAWMGPGFAPGWLGALARPNTDPRSSPVVGGPHGANVPGIIGGMPQQSPRGGSMLPPPPRCKSAADSAASGEASTSAGPRDSTLTDDDINSFLEPGSYSLSLQYGSMDHADESEEAARQGEPRPRRQTSEEARRQGLGAAATPPLPITSPQTQITPPMAPAAADLTLPLTTLDGPKALAERAAMAGEAAAAAVGAPAGQETAEERCGSSQPDEAAMAPVTTPAEEQAGPTLG
uniref:Uncharacterized protein n=1 Tax=Haptolina brevifila TaxID=156173 RepID=A0A7S2MQM5_9EUKA